MEPESEIEASDTVVCKEFESRHSDIPEHIGS
jgi:hypothetical protein